MSEKPLILIVELVQITRETLALILQKDFGFRSAYTGSMSEALELALREPPDLVLTNYVLIDGNGVHLSREIRNNERLCAIPVIMFTGHNDPELRKLAHEAGIDLFLVVPVHPLKLVEHMKPLLENYAAYKAAAKRTPVKCFEK